ncbi:hypothetical protein SK128_009357 [Halocaridina rubra]|uniref:DOMON domain-containing protein n=1 Tax=Halocaridina rubra TaxID=373956 RepID=A0AAN8ZYY7_HALRR
MKVETKLRQKVSTNYEELDRRNTKTKTYRGVTKAYLPAVLHNEMRLELTPRIPEFPARTQLANGEFDNCRQLSDNLQVEWKAHEEEVKIRLTGKVEEDQYMSFGISSSNEKPDMLLSDIVVAFYDKDDGSFHAVDYSVNARSQCDGTFGVCPDEQVHGRNDASVISGERKNGITTITFSRPYHTDDELDIPISRFSDPTSVIASVGQLNSRKEANYHDSFVTKDKVVVDFKSTGDNTCATLVPGNEKEPKRYKPWTVNIINHTTNFTATIGPTGGDRGYSAITSKELARPAVFIHTCGVPFLSLTHAINK